jgi:hypothetical protein
MLNETTMKTKKNMKNEEERVVSACASVCCAQVTEPVHEPWSE